MDELTIMRQELQQARMRLEQLSRQMREEQQKAETDARAVSAAHQQEVQQLQLQLSSDAMSQVDSRRGKLIPPQASVPVTGPNTRLLTVQFAGDTVLHTAGATLLGSTGQVALQCVWKLLNIMGL